MPDRRSWATAIGLPLVVLALVVYFLTKSIVALPLLLIGLGFVVVSLVARRRTRSSEL